MSTARTILKIGHIIITETGPILHAEGLIPDQKDELNAEVAEQIKMKPLSQTFKERVDEFGGLTPEEQKRVDQQIMNINFSKSTHLIDYPVNWFPIDGLKRSDFRFCTGTMNFQDLLNQSHVDKKFGGRQWKIKEGEGARFYLKDLKRDYEYIDGVNRILDQLYYGRVGYDRYKIDEYHKNKILCIQQVKLKKAEDGLTSQPPGGPRLL